MVMSLGILWVIYTSIGSTLNLLRIMGRNASLDDFMLFKHHRTYLGKSCVVYSVSRLYGVAHLS